MLHRLMTRAPTAPSVIHEREAEIMGMSRFDLSLLAVMAACTWAAWVIKELALRRLSAQEEDRLVGFQSCARAHLIVPILVFLVFIGADWLLAGQATVYFLVLSIILGLLLHGVLSQRWLRQRGLPTWFRRSIAIADALGGGGVAFSLCAISSRPW
jgi:hypothetical protein